MNETKVYGHSNAFRWYFYVAVSTTLWKVFVAFKTSDKTLRCENNNLFPRVSHLPASWSGKMRDPGNEVVSTAVKRRTCTQERILASHVKISHKISKVSISYSRCHAKYAKTHHLGIKTQMFNHCVYCATDQIKVSEWHFYPVQFTDFTGKLKT